MDNAQEGCRYHKWMDDAEAQFASAKCINFEKKKRLKKLYIKSLISTLIMLFFRFELCFPKSKLF